MENKKEIEKDLINAISDAKEKARGNITKSLMTMFWAFATLALEGWLMMLLWNYVIPGHEITYLKGVAILVMSRMVLRGVNLSGKEK